MKVPKIIFIFIAPFFCFCNSLFAQQSLVGDMEVWDSTFHPIQWRAVETALSWAPCSVTVKTNDAHSGNWACRLQADTCFDQFVDSYLYNGILLSNVDTNSFIVGLYYHDRPGELNFYYKFHSVLQDTAFACASLRLLDDTNSYLAGTVVGEGIGLIINDTNSYALMTVPINYYTNDTPQILDVFFSTCRPQSKWWYPCAWNHAGTTLWIDDVSLSGGTVGLNEPYFSAERFAVFPNPATNLLTITTSSPQPSQIILFDIASRKLMEDKFSGSATLNIEHLAKGVYLYQIRDEKGMLKQGKVVKE